jgi:signal transduction histidine kinase
VHWEPAAVTVTATNATGTGAEIRTQPVPGRGLTGMRHRAELLGGTFAAGVHDGRFEVRVTLPAATAGRAAR